MTLEYTNTVCLKESVGFSFNAAHVIHDDFPFILLFSSPSPPVFNPLSPFSSPPVFNPLSLPSPSSSHLLPHLALLVNSSSEA